MHRFTGSLSARDLKEDSFDDDFSNDDGGRSQRFGHSYDPDESYFSSRNIGSATGNTEEAYLKRRLKEIDHGKIRDKKKSRFRKSKD